MEEGRPLPDRIRKALARCLRRKKGENATQILPREDEKKS